MESFFVFALIAALLIVAKVVFLRFLQGKQDYPYTSELLFSPAERSFLGVLDKLVGDQYRVMGKVRLADLIKVQGGLGNQARQIAFNKIQSKHIDFVLCDPSDLSVKLAVELDDSSHDAEDRQKRDEFVDKALEAAGIGIVRIKAKRTYSLKEVESALFETDEDEQG